MAGGEGNPLGARALYLGKTLYRIHGTNDPNSIGRAASSGCFRMMNEHVLHLASIANVGTPVTVLKHTGAQTASAPPPEEVEPQDDPYAREPEQDPGRRSLRCPTRLRSLPAVRPLRRPPIGA
jgi:hypothetical protein